MSSRVVAMNRDDATRRVMLAIAIGPMPVDLPLSADDGSKPLVVATPNEYLSAVIERVEALGGSANIALAYARSFTIFTIKGQPSVPGEEDGEPMNEDMSMGMFFIKAQRKGAHGFFRLNNAEASLPAVKKDFAYA